MTCTSLFHADEPIWWWRIEYEPSPGCDIWWSKVVAVSEQAARTHVLCVHPRAVIRTSSRLSYIPHGAT